MIRFARSAHTSLLYEVLSHLDLGRDAANLYRRRLFRPSWAAKLETIYLAAGPERLALQFAGLQFERFDEAGSSSELWSLFKGALELERGAFMKRFAESREREETRIDAAQELRAPLEQLRAALWAPKPAPPLRVLHVPVMGRAGRGYPSQNEHRVAVSLDESWDHVLCQIFHEEVHPISDRELAPLSVRDTLGDEHLLIEANAVDRGEEVIRRVLPEVLPAYERWCASDS